jgi:hypothetical protein
MFGSSKFRAMNVITVFFSHNVFPEAVRLADS